MVASFVLSSLSHDHLLGPDDGAEHMGQIPHVAHSMLQPGVDIGRHGVMEPPAMLGDVQGEGHLHTLLVLDHELSHKEIYCKAVPMLVPSIIHLLSYKTNNV